MDALAIDDEPDPGEDRARDGRARRRRPRLPLVEATDDAEALAHRAPGRLLAAAGVLAGARCRATPGATSDRVRIIPLGGLGEVGKNMTVVESDDGIVVIDAGLVVPAGRASRRRPRAPGLLATCATAKSDIRAVVLTHGHEDHVGALPYLLREVAIPEVWATRLTLGLIKSKLDEHGLLRDAELIEAEPEGGPVAIGPFTAEFVRVAHSIPDAVAVVLDTPAGTIVHTGDYKIDHTPVDGFRTDLGAARRPRQPRRRPAAGRLHERRAARGDAVRAHRRRGLPADHPARRGRVLIASFASNIHRLQQAIDVALEDAAQGVRDRPVAPQEHQHRAEPRLHRRARGHPRQARTSSASSARTRR